MKKFLLSAMAVFTVSVVSSNAILSPAKEKELKLTIETNKPTNQNNFKKDIGSAD